LQPLPSEFPYMGGKFCFIFLSVYSTGTMAGTWVPARRWRDTRSCPWCWRTPRQLSRRQNSRTRPGPGSCPAARVRIPGRSLCARRVPSRPVSRPDCSDASRTGRSPAQHRIIEVQTVLPTETQTRIRPFGQSAYLFSGGREFESIWTRQFDDIEEL
jgi:hypothetical protein